MQQPQPDNEPLLFREQLSLLLECLPIIPFVCDADDPFRILFIHPAIQTIAGYSPGTVTGNPDFWNAHIHPEDQSMALVKLPEFCNACDSPLEYRFAVADGTYKWFRDRRKLLDRIHGTRYIIGSWQDITQEKQLQMESEYRLQQVIQADKLASLGEVVAGVAHEINHAYPVNTESSNTAGFVCVFMSS